MVSKCSPPPQGVFCPQSHPHPCKGGKYCSGNAHKPWMSGDHSCDGTMLNPADSCCPSDAVPCKPENSACMANPINGFFCPLSNPYACAMGSKCSKSPWKPVSDDGEDCDGMRLDEDSQCCPDEDVLPCEGLKCKPNLSNSGES